MARCMGPRVWPRQGGIPFARASAGILHGPDVQETYPQKCPVGGRNALTGIIIFFLQHQRQTNLSYVPNASRVMRFMWMILFALHVRSSIPLNIGQSGQSSPSGATGRDCAVIRCN